jgi:hypothetical protein
VTIIKRFFIGTLAIMLAYSCTKSVNEDPQIINEPEQPEQPVDEDTTTYPYNMRINGVWPKGPARIFSNGKEIQDSIYALNFVLDVIRDHIMQGERYKPAWTLTFLSKDTVRFNYDQQPVHYGIHKEGDFFKLHSEYPVHADYVKDTALYELAPDKREGMFHTVFTTSSEGKNYNLHVFVCKLRQYVPYNDPYIGDTIRLKMETSAMVHTKFKESFVSTLTSLDTFAIQEYNVAYRRN